MTRPGQIQLRQRADRIAHDDPGMINNLLEFRRGFEPLLPGQISLATNKHGIQASEIRVYGRARTAQFVGRGCLQ